MVQLSLPGILCRKTVNRPKCLSNIARRPCGECVVVRTEDGEFICPNGKLNRATLVTLKNTMSSSSPSIHTDSEAEQ